MMIKPVETQNHAPSSDVALDVQDLVKVYTNGKVAVNHISFQVKRGSLFAFLGVNGAGKSTTINIICSILEKTQGKIWVEGYDLDKDRNAIKNLIGVVFQNSVLDGILSVYDNLKFRTAFYSMPKEEEKKKMDDIVRLLDLEPILHQKVNTLSGGQRRRVDIARAIVHAPKFLILDEPTTGLDPKTRQIVWGLIDKVRHETGMTVFLTTHYLEESELATDVVIMNHGKIIAQGTPNDLKNRYSHDYLVAYKPKDDTFEQKLSSDGYAFQYNEEKKLYNIEIHHTDEAKRLLSAFDEELQDVEIRKGTMDDVFLAVTEGQEFENEE